MGKNLNPINSATSNSKTEVILVYCVGILVFVLYHTYLYGQSLHYGYEVIQLLFKDNSVNWVIEILPAVLKFS